MTKNPFINAVSAAVYIVLVALIINNGAKIFGSGPDTLLIPIAMISLFVISASVMGYLFLYEPIQLILGGNKKEGVKLFLQTIAVLAVITIGVFGFAVLMRLKM